MRAMHVPSRTEATQGILDGGDEFSAPHVENSQHVNRGRVHTAMALT
jgi:hypothetical protein